MVEEGFFEDERIELLRGALVRMSPQNAPHASRVQRLNTFLVPLFLGRAEVRVQLLEDVGERGRRLHARADREGEPVRLAVAVVRVLTEQQHRYLVERREAKGVEDVPLGREDLVPLALGVDEGLELLEVRLRQLVADRLAPGLRKLCSHGG